MIGIFCALWLAIYGEEQLRTYLTLMMSDVGEDGVAIVAEESIVPFILKHAPTKLFIIFVKILNVLWRKLSKVLTKWENHRMQDDNDWHYISKMIIFEFVNNFSSLFYIAFYMQDMTKLRSLLADMHIISQLKNQTKESFLPFIFGKVTWKITKKKQMKPCESTLLEDVEYLDPEVDNQRIEQAKEEAALKPFEDGFKDYLEMFEQFGYVCMFSSVYPFAAAWALLNNILELRCDAFKLCQIRKRPQVKRVSSIGVWQGAFTLLGSVGVATNCALLCICPILRASFPIESDVKFLLTFVALEHIIYGVNKAICYVIPDKPFRVRQELEKIDYKSRLVLTTKLVRKGNKDL